MSVPIAAIAAILAFAAGPLPAQVISIPATGGAPQRRPLPQAATGTWEPDSLGNHRAVARVDSGGEAVYVRIPWRRRDPTPESVGVVVMDARTQLRVRNVARMEINREHGDFVFQAPTVPGTYYFYYLPYTGTFKSNYPKITYRPPEATADAAWLQRNALIAQAARFKQYQSLPSASVTGFEAVDEFSRFTPMEYIATRAELDAVRTRYPWAEYFTFAEDRALSIRMSRDIPQRWAQQGPFGAFFGNVRRGEFYAFQIGVWAHRMAIDSL
ncbi:MAG: glycoside hydrolase domain-containing protein, partial [Gemmatimonadota bacterium]